jgi:hypothetical protein
LLRVTWNGRQFAERRQWDREHHCRLSGSPHGHPNNAI